MDRATELSLLDRLLTRIQQGEAELPEGTSEIAASEYLDPARAARETEVLFRRTPQILGHASALRAPGDFMTFDALGLPIVATVDKDGAPRAFLNVCRHRGTRLVSEPCGRDRKAIVCPYHGWTYDLRGALSYIPDAQGFPGLARGARGLVEIPLEARHGLLWILPTQGASLNVASFLGPIDSDLAGLGLDRHRTYRKVTEPRRANWKLLIDAFLEGYHIQHLHRKTLHRFFRDYVFVWDRFRPHMRLASTRTGSREVLERDRSTWSLRAASTFYYLLFPSSILLFHPDFVSLLRALPDGPDRFIWDHEMLIPEDADTPEMADHWAKSFSLIEETVFQKEDLAAVESIQAGLRSGANTTFPLGRFEAMIRCFHDDIDAALAAADQGASP